MKEKLYTIEEMIEKFTEHSKKYTIEMEKVIENFKERNPGQPLPEHLTDDFSLTTALLSMCKKIKELDDYTDCLFEEEKE